MRTCNNCAKTLAKRHQIKFCSNGCQKDFEYGLYVKHWKSGKKDGNIGISARSISRHLKRFLREKFGDKCSKCGWNEKHPTTGNVPLEVDHIDGNSENNFENNLMLLCPNCHALTVNYKSLNRGHGRSWRTKKYIKIEK